MLLSYAAKLQELFF
jgi:hypothetical protein